jgi:hypothetical protein
MIGYQDKINQILRGAETIKNMNDDIDLELSVSVLTKTLKDVQLERDALWVKTQEDEREINQLLHSNKERLIQRTQLLEIAEELAGYIINKGYYSTAIEDLDEWYRKWGISEPFKRNLKA